MVAPNFGPWSPSIDSTERRARCRALRAITALLIGRHKILGELAEAETDDAALAAAGRSLDGLPTRSRRRLLASYLDLANHERRA